MRTPSQQNASRTNGAKSNGPVSPEGKARVSQNGTTHGIYTRRVVLAGEDQQAYNDLHHSLVIAWQPVNEFEANLITDVAEARWRLARFTSLETSALDLQVEMMRPSLDEEWPGVDPGSRHILAFNDLITRNRTLEVLQAAIRNQHRIINRATSQLIQLRKLRPDLSSAPSTAPSTNTLTVTPEQLSSLIDAAVDQRLAAATAGAAAPAEPPALGPEQTPKPQQQPIVENHESKPGNPVHARTNTPQTHPAGAARTQHPDTGQGRYPVAA